MGASLNFAIVGCGKIAPRHAVEAARQGKLKAVCDIVEAKADELAKSFGATPYYNLKDLFNAEKQLDLVAICTPNGLHAAHAIEALQAGCHVLCEKPLCLTVADAKKMIDVAEKCDRQLFVVKSTRYNPVLMALKEMIGAGALGKVYSFQLNCFWNRPPEYYRGTWKGTALDGGTLYTQFSHYIDALLWVLGNIRHIAGFRKNMAHQGIILSEDSGVISLEMENGVLGGINWSVNSFRKNMEVSLSIIAEKGSIRIGGPYMNKVEYQDLEGQEIPAPGRDLPNDYGYYQGSMSHHDQVYANLVMAIRDKDHPFTHAADGLKTVEAIERIYNAVTLS